MSGKIYDAKRRRPLPELMQQCGLGDHAKKSACRPFDKDKPEGQDKGCKRESDARLVIVPPETRLRPQPVRNSLCLSPHKTSARAEAWGQKGHFYRPLPKKFQRDGFIYRQIAREGDAAIYEQTWSGCANPSVCHEVISIRRREGFKIDGRWVEPAEVYPNSEAWGVDGWTVLSRDAAFEKLREICR